MKRIVRPLFWSALFLLTVFSLLPSVHLSHTRVLFDSAPNILVYCLLGFCGCLAHPVASSRVAGFLIFYGLGIELVQGGAVWGLGNWLDLLANAIGVGSAFLGWKHFIRPLVK
jgi:hypothetical protein